MANWKPGDPERRATEMGAEERQHKISVAAAEAAKVVSDAAAIAIQTIASAASAAQSVVNLDIGYIKRDVAEIKKMLDDKYITKSEFWPVKTIAYGLVSLVLVAVVGSVMTIVITKR